MTITDCFASYYEELYTSRVTYTSDEFSSDLSGVDFQLLTSTYRDYLGSPITFPNEFYKMYADDLALHAMLVKSLRPGSLPSTMSGW